jgi:coenzyme F420-reducing hydrogenase alpha subunit
VKESENNTSELWSELQKQIDDAKESGDLVAAYINAIAKTLDFKAASVVTDARGELVAIVIGDQSFIDTSSEELEGTFEFEDIERPDYN